MFYHAVITVPIDLYHLSIYMYICVRISVCVTNAFQNLNFLLVLIIVNFYHDCYGEYLTIANFNVDQFTICVDEGVCVWERVVSCYVMCFYLIVGQ